MSESIDAQREEPGVYLGTPELRNKEARDVQSGVAFPPKPPLEASDLGIEFDAVLDAIHAEEKKPAPLVGDTELERQLEADIREHEKNRDRWMHALAAGELDTEHPGFQEQFEQVMRASQAAIESNTNLLKLLRKGGSVEDTKKKIEPLVLFEKYAQETLKHAAPLLEDMQKIEKLFRRGEISIADYEAATMERRAALEADEDGIASHAVGIDPTNPTFKRIHEELKERLSMRGIDASERVDVFFSERVFPVIERYSTLEDVEKRQAVADRIREGLVKLRGLSAAEVNELMERVRAVLKLTDTAYDEHRGTVPLMVPEEELVEVEPLLEMKEYDEQIREMERQVSQWESVADTLQNAGKLSKEVRDDLLGELRKYPAQILELDEKIEKPDASSERRALVEQLAKLRERLQQEPYDEFAINLDALDEVPSPDATIPLPNPIRRSPQETQEYKPVQRQGGVNTASVAGEVNATHARAAYREVVAAYTSVQHTLTVDQRRDIRTRIARMAGLVRQAELAHAISHATEHAPAIAHATLASMPSVPPRYEVKTLPTMQTQSKVEVTKPSRGIFGALGAAFRLK